MNDSIKRAARSAAQGFVAVLALIALPVLNNLVQTVAGGGTVQIDVNAWQSIGLAAVAGAATGLISWGQNELERKTGHDALPK